MGPYFIHADYWAAKPGKYGIVMELEIDRETSRKGQGNTFSWMISLVDLQYMDLPVLFFAVYCRLCMTWP